MDVRSERIIELEAKLKLDRVHRAEIDSHLETLRQWKADRKRTFFLYVYVTAALLVAFVLLDFLGLIYFSALAMILAFVSLVFTAINYFRMQGVKRDIEERWFENRITKKMDRASLKLFEKKLLFFDHLIPFVEEYLRIVDMEIVDANGRLDDLLRNRGEEAKNQAQEEAKHIDDVFVKGEDWRVWKGTGDEEEARLQTDGQNIGRSNIENGVFLTAAEVKALAEGRMTADSVLSAVTKNNLPTKAVDEEDLKQKVSESAMEAAYNELVEGHSDRSADSGLSQRIVQESLNREELDQSNRWEYESVLTASEKQEIRDEAALYDPGANDFGAGAAAEAGVTDTMAQLAFARNSGQELQKLRSAASEPAGEQILLRAKIRDTEAIVVDTEQRIRKKKNEVKNAKGSLKAYAIIAALLLVVLFVFGGAMAVALTDAGNMLEEGAALAFCICEGGIFLMAIIGLVVVGIFALRSIAVMNTVKMEGDLSFIYKSSVLSKMGEAYQAIPVKNKVPLQEYFQFEDQYLAAAKSNLDHLKEEYRKMY